MRNFQDTLETCKRSFNSAFAICMTVPLSVLSHQQKKSFMENLQNLLRKSPYSFQMRENTDQKSSEYGHFFAQCSLP